MIRDFQEYVEPGEDFPASPQRRATATQEDRDDSVVLPLGADTLTHNLGLPVLVVCTKVSVLPGSLASVRLFCFWSVSFLDDSFLLRQGLVSDSFSSGPDLQAVEPQASTTMLMRCSESETGSLNENGVSNRVFMIELHFHNFS